MGSQRVGNDLATELTVWLGFPGGSMVKNLPAMQETSIQSLGWEDPWRRKWQATPVFLPGKYHGQMNLMGYSPWGSKRAAQ